MVSAVELVSRRKETPFYKIETVFQLLPKKPFSYELTALSEKDAWSDELYDCNQGNHELPATGGRWLPYTSEVCLTCKSDEKIERSTVNATVMPADHVLFYSARGGDPVFSNDDQKACYHVNHYIKESSTQVIVTGKCRKRVKQVQTQHIQLADFGGRPVDRWLGFGTYVVQLPAGFSTYDLELRGFDGSIVTLNPSVVETGPVRAYLERTNSSISQLTIVVSNPYGSTGLWGAAHQ